MITNRDKGEAYLVSAMEIDARSMAKQQQLLLAMCHFLMAIDDRLMETEHVHMPSVAYKGPLKEFYEDLP